MAELPTPDELRKEIEGSLRTSLDPNGTGAVNLRAGSDNAAYVSVVTLLGGRLIAYSANRVAARSPFDATGDDLEDIGRDLFEIKKKGAQRSTGRLYLQRTGILATSIPLGQRFLVPADENETAVTFEATETVPVGAGELKAKVRVRCTVEGEVGNVALARVTNIPDQMADTTWSLFVPIGGDAILDGLTSPEVIGGGRESETDSEFQTRVLQRSLDDSRQRGTARAVLAGAMTVASVAFATAIEPRDGTILLFVGDRNYGLSVEMQLAVETALEEYRCLGIPVIVRPYSVQLVPVRAVVYMSRPLVNYDRGTITNAIIKSVKDYFSADRAHPDEYYLNAIEGAMFKANTEIQQVSLSVPSANQQRPTDVGYSALLQLNRYVADESNIFITLADPLAV